MARVRYPFEPTSDAHLAPGQFWGIPLSDGRWACGRVLGVAGDAGDGPAGRTWFRAGLLDWSGDREPTAETIAKCALLADGWAHIRAIRENGRVILGQRDLALDDIDPRNPVRTYWGDGTIKALAESAFVRGESHLRDAHAAGPAYNPWFREVSSPLTEDMLAPLPPECRRIQFSRDLRDNEYIALAQLLEDHPNVTLRAYGGQNNTLRDLEFLRWFPRLRRFAADLLDVNGIAGLRHLPEDLELLHLGQTRRPISLEPLRQFPGLRRLFLEHHTKDLSAIMQLTKLQSLTLRSITLRDLQLLRPLARLRALDLKLGATHDLTLLPHVGRLEYVELWSVRGLDDLSAISGVETLETLFLQALPRVAALPDMSRLDRLRRIHLESMKGVNDLTPLLTAKALEQVVLLDLPRLSPDHFRPLTRHPSLREATVGLSSRTRTRDAEAVLALPASTWGSADRHPALTLD